MWHLCVPSTHTASGFPVPAVAVEETANEVATKPTMEPPGRGGGSGSLRMLSGVLSSLEIMERRKEQRRRQHEEQRTWVRGEVERRQRDRAAYEQSEAQRRTLEAPRPARRASAPAGGTLPRGTGRFRRGTHGDVRSARAQMPYLARRLQCRWVTHAYRWYNLQRFQRDESPPQRRPRTIWHSPAALPVRGSLR